jgi:glutamyl-tRNA synthetase
LNSARLFRKPLRNSSSTVIVEPAFCIENIMSVRVRFAPSPTGFLHIGGARTALFNWLYARHTGGTFVLRIEDTDVARNTQKATDVILDGLRWLGLDWDEGPMTSDPKGPSKGEHGPYFQSQRKEFYARRVRELIDKGLAYESDKAIKFRMQREPVIINDLVVGEVRRELTDREQADPDFVIVRSDGEPVFHLVNVLDDLDMNITHVIRGEDHLSNTAKHIALFKAFGAQPPQYAHIPLILNADGTKMSKRDKGASLQSYLDDGCAPEAVVNYLCLLGWSPKDNREKMPVSDIVKLFDLPQILRHNARFDLGKLQWLDGEYLREMSDERFRDQGVQALVRAGLNISAYPAPYVATALATCKGKIKQFSELPAYGGFYFKEEVALTPEIIATDFTSESKARLTALRDAISAMPEFTATAIEATLKSVAKEHLKIKPGLLIHPTRLALTGSGAGPSLWHLIEILGKERVLKRLNAALAL